MSKKRVSLKDIASHLGVSISTVSRALKDHPDLSDEVIIQVKELAERWNYTPNPMAMALLKQKTNTIGVIVPDIATHFFSSIISGIESTVREESYNIVITSSQESAEKEKENIKNLVNLRVDGLLVCLSQDTKDYSHFERIKESDIPLVFFDRVCLTNQFSSVVIDNQSAARDLVMHLFHNGCRKIAYISGPQNLNISRERLIGYRRGLQECNLPFREKYVIESSLSIEGGVFATKKLISLKYPPDAIIGINDTVIYTCMKVLKKSNYSIPQDISLVGFTDDFHATEVEPNLTTITHPTYEIGQESARLVLNSIEAKNPRSLQHIVMQAKLNIRESSVKNSDLLQKTLF